MEKNDFGEKKKYIHEKIDFWNMKKNSQKLLSRPLDGSHGESGNHSQQVIPLIRLRYFWKKCENDIRFEKAEKFVNSIRKFSIRIGWNPKENFKTFILKPKMSFLVENQKNDN